jgi:hypothetical protein
MKPSLLPYSALAIAVLLPLNSLLAQEPSHPRLMFGAKDVAGLRQKIKSEPAKSMYERLVKDVETDNWAKGPAKLGDPSDEATIAHRCAFLYVLTGNDSWAKKAREYIEKRINSADWANGGEKGLRLYYSGKSIALAYDWCYGAPSWDAAFSKLVSEKLLAQANTIFEKGGKEQNNDPASNWQALRWSTGGLCYLATDEAFEPARIDQCYSKVERYLRENVGPAGKSRGWNIEGLGYTYYPMANGVLPFAVAMNLKNPARDLRKACEGGSMMLWTCYAAMVPTSAGLFRPDFGDDNAGTDGEGSFGFAFYFCPPALHPGMKYWYDRTVGSLGNKTFDNARFGTIASILFYPGADVAGKDPMTIPEWVEAFSDTAGNGFNTWRSQYQGSDDLVAQLNVKLRGSRGHGGPDALSFRIIGLDTMWAVGGGRYGTKLNGQDAYLRSMNTLYPNDPDGALKISGGSGHIVGEPVVNATGGGHIVSEIPMNNLGVSNHKRRFITDYSKASGTEGAFVICDSSDDGAFWQFCTLATNQITTDGNTFTITGATGNVLKGTVLYPPGPIAWKTGTRVRGSEIGTAKENNFVHFQSADGCYLLALTIAKKGAAQPAPTATGTWGKSPQGTVKIGKFQVAIDGDSITYPAAK